MAKRFEKGRHLKLERRTRISDNASSSKNDNHEETSLSTKTERSQTPKAQRQISPTGGSQHRVVSLRRQDGHSPLYTGLSVREYRDYRQLREKYTAEPAYQGTDPLPDMSGFHRLLGYSTRLQHCLEHSPELSKVRSEVFERWIGVFWAEDSSLKFAYLQRLLNDITRMLRTALLQPPAEQIIKGRS